MNYDGSMVYAKTNYDNQPGSFTPFTQTINNSVSPLVIARDGAMTISEIIIMNKGLNAAQEKIINNYLSRKHKIGLYFNGYINNDNFPYNGDIIGVGRGSSSAYHLRSSGGGLGIEADSTSLSSTNSFIFAAHNNLDSVKIKNDFINRFYYIHSQEATGDKVIKGSLFFLFDSLGLTVPTAADGYKLYYSPSGSAEFTGDTVASTPTLVGNTIKFTLDTIKTGYYALGKATKPIGLSVKNVKESGKFNATIYPNPVQSQLNVELNTDVNSSFMLNVYNIYGSKLISKTEPWNINLAMVNVTELPKGIYLLEIIQGETKKTLRFVKQ